MIRCTSSTFISRFAVVSASLWLVGCSTLSGGLSPDQIVRRGAEQHSQAMMKGDLAAIYALTAPSYRKLQTFEAFKSRFGAGAYWTKAEVGKVICETERCIADITVQVKPLIPGKNVGTIAVPLQDIWLLEDGEWWLYQGL